MRTIESGAVLVLRAIEEEGIKNRFTSLTVYVPTDTAVYLLNQKRKNLSELEDRYHMSVVIASDSTIRNVSDYKIERQRTPKSVEPETEAPVTASYDMPDDEADFANDENENDAKDEQTERSERRFGRRRNRFDRRFGRGQKQQKSERPVVLYSSDDLSATPEGEKKKTWWRRLIG